MATTDTDAQPEHDEASAEYQRGMEEIRKQLGVLKNPDKPRPRDVFPVPAHQEIVDEVKAGYDLVVAGVGD